MRLKLSQNLGVKTSGWRAKPIQRRRILAAANRPSVARIFFSLAIFGRAA
jgi:hypothetical protein